MPPERLLLVVDGRVGKHQDSDLAGFAAQLNTMLPCSLPNSYGGKKLYRFGSVRAFVCFDKSWNPTLLPLTVDLVPFFRRSVRRRLVPYIREALRPVLTRLGYPPAPPRLSVFAIAFTFGFGLILLLAAFELTSAVFVR